MGVVVRDPLPLSIEVTLHPVKTMYFHYTRVRVENPDKWMPLDLQVSTYQARANINVGLVHQKHI